MPRFRSRYVIIELKPAWPVWLPVDSSHRNSSKKALNMNIKLKIYNP